MTTTDVIQLFLALSLCACVLGTQWFARLFLASLKRLERVQREINEAIDTLDAIVITEPDLDEIAGSNGSNGRFKIEPNLKGIDE